MTILSGRHAVVNGVSSVRNWTINNTQTAAKFVASNTLLGTGRRKAVRSWTGSFGGYGGVPTVLPLSSFSFAGYCGPTDGVSGNGITYSGTALVDSLTITWDWNAGAILSWVCNFSGHLALTKASASHSDTTDPEVPGSCGTKITYSDAGEDPEDIEWPNLVTATLTLNSPSIPYVNSSTIVSGACWTGRKAGIFDWTLAVTEQNDDRIAALEIGEDKALKLWIDDTDYWVLNWGHIEGYSGLQSNRETGAIIQRTVNLSMNGFLDGDTGAVTLPGAMSNLWPIP